MLLFSHYTRLEPGTNERKNKQNWAMFYYKKSSWMILEKYLPSSTYYLERKEKMIAPPFTSVCEMITTYNVNSIT